MVSPSAQASKSRVTGEVHHAATCRSLEDHSKTVDAGIAQAYVDIITSVPHGTPSVRRHGLPSAHPASAHRARHRAHPKHRRLMHDDREWFVGVSVDLRTSVPLAAHHPQDREPGSRAEHDATFRSTAHGLLPHHWPGVGGGQRRAGSACARQALRKSSRSAEFRSEAHVSPARNANRRRRRFQLRGSAARFVPHQRRPNERGHRGLGSTQK